MFYASDISIYRIFYFLQHQTICLKFSGIDMRLSCSLNSLPVQFFTIAMYLIGLNLDMNIILLILHLFCLLAPKLKLEFMTQFK